jgi:uncharacterized repeat protein (TIGR03833 family)
MYYISENQYFYKLMGGKKRIKRIKKPSKLQSIPKIGDIVSIIVKPYRNCIIIKGKIKKLLTKKKTHPRGHKVCLEDGTIGRIYYK